jgi:hypothetical protein
MTAHAVAIKQRSRAKQKLARRRIAGPPGDELAASRRQHDYENASSNRTVDFATSGLEFRLASILS